MTDLPTPPIAPRHPLRLEQLGRVRVDDYAWMKDERWQELLRDPGVLRPEVRQHLEAENAYCAAVLKETEALQTTLIAEMRGRIKEDDFSAPTGDGPWDYYSRYETGAEHPVFARRPRGTDEGEVVLLDADLLSKGTSFFQIADLQHTADHGRIVYAVDTQGSEYFRLFIKDLKSGETVDTGVAETTGDFLISPDDVWLFWIYRDEHGRSSRLYRRPLDGTGACDVLVHEEADQGMFMSVSLTESERFIVLTIANHDTSEVRLLDVCDIEGAPSLVEPRTPGLRYGVTHWPTGDQPGRLIILNDADGAVDFQLSVADASAPGRAHWRPFLPCEPGRYIVGVAALRDYLVRQERVDANDRIVITRRDTGDESIVDFDEPAYAASFQTGYEFVSDTLRIVYHSPTTPRTWFDLDLKTGERRVRKVQTIPSGHDPARYEARRLMARAKDGAEVPVTVLMQRGQALDGSAPLLLYGYGSYGLPIEPGFSIRALSLVDRGFVYAIAHIRGGSEKGWGWFLDGRGRNKPNTFTDFIASAEALIAGGYSRAGKIVAMGGSAGGMLMGAVANLRPDLFAGIVAQVPFVDVLNTMSDASLPLTPPEWPEWGNPLESAEDYDFIASYSPYDNVVAQPYPPVLATGGLSDPRVTYWEPAKWIARLRAHSTSDAPMVLKINMEAGHGGASGRFDSLKETALDYAFALWAAAR